MIKSLTQNSIFKSYKGINDRKDDNKLEDVRGLYKYLITHPLIANKAHPWCTTCTKFVSQARYIEDSTNIAAIICINMG